MFSVIATLFGLILDRLTSINTRLTAIENDEIKETADETASTAEMQALIDSVRAQAPTMPL